MRTLILTITLLLIACKGFGQNCPLNVDFSTGTFANWQCYTGSTDEKMIKGALTNVITLNPAAAVKNMHVIIPKGTDVDKYGKFPTSAPNGSSYSVKLGNNGAGKQAEAISYTLDIPANQQNFALTYSYAVVLQTSTHWNVQQARFLARVYNLTDNAYIDCAGAEYVTTASLPGFQKSVSYPDVVFKPWSSVTLNLSAYRGKKLRLEFTTAACTQGGHFGYAYIAISQACTALITGTDYCGTVANVTLGSPAGYAAYKWYNADHSKVLGTSTSLNFPTPPADGTVVDLELTPYPGFGCPNTVTATLHNHGPNLVVSNLAPACFPATIDITGNKAITATGYGIKLSYWTDAAATQPLSKPSEVTTSGTYYVKATNDLGCSVIKPVAITINPPPELRITDPKPVCDGNTINITAPTITAGSSGYLSLTYWSDALATRPLTNPQAIITAGTYYIKAINRTGCSLIKPVNVSFYPLPELLVNDPTAVCYPATVNLVPTVNSHYGDNVNLSYWKDAAATINLANYTKVAVTGTYYIKATSVYGCETIKPVKVLINALPQLVVNKPPDVCYPARVDLSAASVTEGSSGIVTLNYWKDADATIPLKNYKAVVDSGLYYIKAVNASGCSMVQPVLVNIHQLPTVKVVQPKGIYQPKTIDLTKTIDPAKTTANATLTYWADGALKTQVPNPKAVNQSGTYYVKAANAYGCYAVAAIEVFLAPVPDILVPTAFTPMQATNKTLYPFLKGIKSFKFFRLYNRWGNVVYQTTEASPDKGWDGNFKGSIALLDTFTWVSEGIDYLGNTVHRSGNTVLLK